MVNLLMMVYFPLRVWKVRVQQENKFLVEEEKEGPVLQLCGQAAISDEYGAAVSGIETGGPGVLMEILYNFGYFYIP